MDYYQRAAISEEVLAIVKMAWTQSEVTYDGEYFHFDEALPHPRPYQQPHPPIRGSHSRGMGRDSERADNKARGQTMAEAARSYEFNTQNGLALVGSPESIVRRLRAGQQRMGYDLFCTNHQIGHMPPDLVDRSIELFGKEVIPAFAAAPVAAPDAPPPSDRHRRVTSVTRSVSQASRGRHVGVRLDRLAATAP